MVDHNVRKVIIYHSPVIIKVEQVRSWGQLASDLCLPSRPASSAGIIIILDSTKDILIFIY